MMGPEEDAIKEYWNCIRIQTISGYCATNVMQNCIRVIEMACKYLGFGIDEKMVCTSIHQKFCKKPFNLYFPCDGCISISFTGIHKIISNDTKISNIEIIKRI